MASAIACFSLLGLPGIASAQDEQPASATCGGKVTFAPDSNVEDALGYSLRCNQTIKGYSIFVSRTVDYFSTEVISYDDAGEATPEGAQCEGPFPGSGFGCRGTINNGSILRGEFAVSRDPCQVSNIADRFRVFAMVFTRVTDVLNRQIDVASAPVRLKPLDCTTAPSARTVSNVVSNTIGSLFV